MAITAKVQGWEKTVERAEPTQGAVLAILSSMQSWSGNRLRARIACLVDASASNLGFDCLLPFQYTLLSSFILWQQRFAIPAECTNTMLTDATPCTNESRQRVRKDRGGIQCWGRVNG